MVTIFISGLSTPLSMNMLDYVCQPEKGPNT